MKKLGIRFFIVALLAISLIYIGCKKDDDEPENEKPSVSISAPLDGTTYTAGDTIEINVTASDPDGSISEVKIYINDQEAGSATAAPYNFLWATDDVPAGTYNIKASAIDNSRDSKSTQISVSILTDTTFVSDGLYITGTATALTNLHENGKMNITRNLVRNGEYNDGSIQEDDRPELQEIYVAVKATGGFNIVGVNGSTQVVYGPGSDFAEVTNAAIDEPTESFWRGGFIETSNQFTVPEDGLYHIVIDTELEKVVVAKVPNWGIIGGATPIGWNGDIQLPSQGFNLNTMTFKAEGIQLSANDFKFRYSGGWRIILDSIYDFGGVNSGISVNTNYGGEVDDLVPGGSNIYNAIPGIYTVEMIWTLGEVYEVILTKTGDLPTTDWSEVSIELVGTGVSSDNANAIPDPSSWNWGNVLGHSGGYPVNNGNVYTWDWSTVILEANEGFKIRTINGEAPANGNGFNFDAGYNDLNIANSSSLIIGSSGNLIAINKTVFNISIEIDAMNNNNKTITITESK